MGFLLARFYPVVLYVNLNDDSSLFDVLHKVVLNKSSGHHMLTVFFSTCVACKTGLISENQHVYDCFVFEFFASFFLINHNYSFIHAYELMLGLHVFRQTGPPRRVDCLAPPSVCHIKTEASR